MAALLTDETLYRQMSQAPNPYGDGTYELHSILWGSNLYLNSKGNKINENWSQFKNWLMALLACEVILWCFVVCSSNHFKLFLAFSLVCKLVLSDLLLLGPLS